MDKRKFESMTDAEKYDYCLKILATYPEGHPDRVKGEKMIRAWKKKEEEKGGKHDVTT
jgi:hypothetical protein